MTTAIESTAGPEVSALERHASFFTRADPDRVSFSDTTHGLRRVGVKSPLCYLLAFIIHTFLGYLTNGKPSFTILVKSIALGKHPYDTGTFDDQGRFDPTAFAALFAAAGDPITSDEMRSCILARKNRRRAMGCVAGALGRWFSSKEVRLLFCVAADTTKVVDGRAVPAMRRRTLQRFYDGTLLPAIARARLLGWAARQPSLPSSVLVKASAKAEGAKGFK
jgi:Caleosin related protein